MIIFIGFKFGRPSVYFTK